MSEQEPVVYYFGDARHAGLDAGAGHYLWRATAQGTLAWMDDEGRVPWPIHGGLDGWLAGRPGVLTAPGRGHREVVVLEAEQGRACLHHLDGWTAISFFDRTGDDRWGSTSTVLALGTHTFEVMKKLFNVHLPGVWARVMRSVNVHPHPGNQDPPEGLRVETLGLRIASVLAGERVVAAEIEAEHDEDLRLPMPAPQSLRRRAF